jgi:hypothetical protein
MFFFIFRLQFPSQIISVATAARKNLQIRLTTQFVNPTNYLFSPVNRRYNLSVTTTFHFPPDRFMSTGTSAFPSIAGFRVMSPSKRAISGSPGSDESSIVIEKGDVQEKPEAGFS